MHAKYSHILLRRKGFSSEQKKIIVGALVLLISWWTGSKIVVCSPNLLTYAFLISLIIVFIIRDPTIWLILVVLLSAFRTFDNVVLGGFLSWSKILTALMLLIFVTKVAIKKSQIYLLKDWMIPIILIIGWASISLIWAFDKRLAATKLLSWINLFILHWLIYTLFKDNIDAVEKALYAHIFAMVCFSVIGISIILFSQETQLPRTVAGYGFFRTPIGITVGRFFGFFADANATALLLTYAIIWAVVLANYLSQVNKARFKSFFLFICIWPMALALVSTFSRTGILAFLAGSLYLLQRTKLRFYSLLVISGFILIAYVLRGGLFIRFGELAITGWGTRLYELKYGLWQFVEEPILGIGLKSFRPKLLAMGIRIFRDDVPVMHSNYFRFLVELGIPGFLLLTWFCVALIKRFQRNEKILKCAKNQKLWWINLGFGACFFSTAFFAIPLGVDTFNQFWILLGLYAVISSSLEKINTMSDLLGTHVKK